MYAIKMLNHAELKTKSIHGTKEKKVFLCLSSLPQQASVFKTDQANLVLIKMDWKYKMSVSIRTFVLIPQYPDFRLHLCYPGRQVFKHLHGLRILPVRVMATELLFLTF